MRDEEGLKEREGELGAGKSRVKHEEVEKGEASTDMTAAIGITDREEK